MHCKNTNLQNFLKDFIERARVGQIPDFHKQAISMGGVSMGKSLPHWLSASISRKMVFFSLYSSHVG